MNDWVSFYLATAGASAGLTGLIFVSLSISISKILSEQELIDRAFISIMLMMNSLIISLLNLIPGQSITVFGIEIIIAGFLSWLIVTWLDKKKLRSKQTQFRKIYITNLLFDQIALIPFIVAGIFTLINCGGAEYWTAAGILFSLIKAILDSWVLLVEINR